MCFNLSRCDERIGSLTRRQPTKSPNSNVGIGKPVLNPTSDESKRKDELKKEKMRNTQFQNKIKKRATQSSAVHLLVNTPINMAMRCCCCMC